MLIALYRWRIKTGSEQQFIVSWSEITLYYREEHGSLGSRLHRGNDGLFYGYAMWPSIERRAAAFETGGEHPARAGMIEAIAESFPEVLLDVEADFLLPNPEPILKSE